MRKYSVNDPPVLVVAEDIDILVLKTDLTQKDRTVYFLTPAKGNKSQKMFSSKSLDERPLIRDNILFLHAMSESDRASNFFGKGKTSIVENLYKNVSKQGKNELEMAIDSFKNPKHETVFSNDL